MLRIDIELLFASFAAEIIGLTLILALAGGLFRVHPHAANNVLFHLVSPDLQASINILNPIPSYSVKKFSGGPAFYAVHGRSSGSESYVYLLMPESDLSRFC